MAASNVLNPDFGKLRQWVAEAVRLYFEPLRWLLAPFRRDASSQAAVPDSVVGEHHTTGNWQPHELASMEESLRGQVGWDLEVLDRIVIDPRVRSGKPVIRGTRITVRDVMEYLSGGMTAEEILEDFPQLSDDDIRAVQSYAAEHGQA